MAADNAYATGICLKNWREIKLQKSAESEVYDGGELNALPTSESHPEEARKI